MPQQMPLDTINLDSELNQIGLVIDIWTKSKERVRDSCEPLRREDLLVGFRK